MSPTSTSPVPAAVLEQRIRQTIPSLSGWACLEVVEAVQLQADPSAELERLLRSSTSARVKSPESYLLSCARRLVENADRAA